MTQLKSFLKLQVCIKLKNTLEVFSRFSKVNIKICFVTLMVNSIENNQSTKANKTFQRQSIKIPDIKFHKKQQNTKY